MNLPLFFAICAAVLVCIVVLPRRWVERLLPDPIDQLPEGVLVASTEQTVKPKWLVCIRFLVQQYRAVAATTVAVVIVFASLYVLITEGAEIEWARNGLASGVGFLFGEAVGIRAKK